MSFVYSHPFTGLSNGLQTINGGSATVGGWVELGRTTLGSSGDTIDVTSLSDKRYYMLLLDQNSTGGNTNIKHTFNGDTGSNYANRRSINGATDATSTSGVNVTPTTVSGANERFSVEYITNLSSNEKLCLSHTVGNQGGTGAANDPDRAEYAWKWANTSNALDQITVTNTSPGSYNTNSELVVLGWDPADTHTNNFWEELADVTGGASSNVSSGTITAKKYLWVQFWFDRGSTFSCTAQFNNDTSTNYSTRLSRDGAADVTDTSASNIALDAGGASGKPEFINMFIINNASNEKLCIIHEIQANSAGAANAPIRQETVSKWTNTSNQITEIDFNTSTSTFVSGARLKVWGAD